MNIKSNDTSVSVSLNKATVGNLLLDGTKLVLGGITGKKITNVISSIQLVITTKNKKNTIKAKTIPYSFETTYCSDSTYQKYKNLYSSFNIISQ